MCQQEVLKLLEKEDRWMTNREIAAILGVSNQQRVLKILFQQGEILQRFKKIEKTYGFINCPEWRIK